MPTRKPRGFGSFLKSKLNSAIETGKKIEAQKAKRKPATKAKNRTKAQLKGATSKGIVGRARNRRDNRLNSIMGEMRKTRGR